MSTIVFPPTNIRGEWLHHSCEILENEKTGNEYVILRNASDDVFVVDTDKPIVIRSEDDDRREWAMVQCCCSDGTNAQTRVFIVVAASRALALAWRFGMKIQCPDDGEVYVIGKGFSE